MKVKVVRLRHEGKPHPRWRLSTLESVVGELRIEEAKDENLSRFMRRARLLNLVLQESEMLPPLIDAAVLWLKGNSLAITGFERIESTDYAQTWLIEVVSN
jgi:hypothetical protein